MRMRHRFKASLLTGLLAGPGLCVAQPAAAPADDAPPPPSTNITNAQVVVSDSGTVEMHVSDTPLLDVLRVLSIQSRKNIVASNSVNGRVTANLYNVTLPQALDAILQSNGYVYREKDNFIYVYTAKEMADMDRAARRVATEVFHLYYTPAANAAAMIKPALSAEAQVAVTAEAKSGINVNSESAAAESGGNSHSAGDMLVITDFADNLVQVRKILKEVDRRPQQVLVEATILAATLNDNNALGVDFSVLGGVRFDQFLATPAQTVANAASSALTKQDGSAQGNYGVGQTNFTNNVPPGGLRVGVLTNNISVFVQALESVTNTTVLANPKVLALDKQLGYVHVGRSDGYQTTTVSSTTSTQTVQFLDSGTTLAFRPYIGDDGYVRMEIHPEDSSGGLTASNLPFKSTTEVTTNLMVKDGRTIVIGGLFRDSVGTSRGQVPGIGNVPFVGALFRQQQDQATRQEIIVLLTPHILKDDSAYSKLSEAQVKRVESLRVGVRQGMMFFGRERLAQSAYENAVSELSKPKADQSLALWHLNSATNLNPTFIEAIELKEKVSGRRITHADHGIIRDFVARAILEDIASVPPPAGSVVVPSPEVGRP